MKRLLILAAVLEVVTGVALLIAPALAARLLLGADVSGAGAVMGRVAGLALLSLGLACWPGQNLAVRSNSAFQGLLTYNLLVTCYLVVVGIGGEWVGVLLWPGVGLHGVLTCLLIRAWFRAEQNPETR